MRLLFIYVCTFQYLKFLFLTWCESYKSYMYVCVKVKGKEMGDCHWPLTIDPVGCADADQLERQLFTVSVDREIVLPGFVEWVVGDRCCTTRHRCGPATFFCCFRQGLSVVEDQWLRWIIPFLPTVTIVGCCIAIARTFVTLYLVFWPGTSSELDYPLFGCAICSDRLDFVVVLYWVVRKWCHIHGSFCCYCAERKWRQCVFCENRSYCCCCAVILCQRTVYWWPWRVETVAKCVTICERSSEVLFFFLGERIAVGRFLQVRRMDWRIHECDFGQSMWTTVGGGNWETGFHSLD